MDDSLLLHLSEIGVLTSLPPYDPWHRLSLYEHPELLRPLVEKNITSTPDEQAIRAASAYLAQRHQYFRSATNADLLVRRLLLFYGVMSFGESIILVRESAQPWAPRSAGHGLQRLNWNGLFAQSSGTILNAKVRVNS